VPQIKLTQKSGIHTLEKTVECTIVRKIKKSGKLIVQYPSFTDETNMVTRTIEESRLIYNHDN